MNPKQVKLHQLTDAQRAQIVAALEPIMVEILEIEAEEHPISFGDILLRKFGERHELSVNFWPKDDYPILPAASPIATVGTPPSIPFISSFISYVCIYRTTSDTTLRVAAPALGSTLDRGVGERVSNTGSSRKLKGVGYEESRAL